jgi:hypothetical protein
MQERVVESGWQSIKRFWIGNEGRREALHRPELADNVGPIDPVDFFLGAVSGERKEQQFNEPIEKMHSLMVARKNRWAPIHSKEILLYSFVL